MFVDEMGRVRMHVAVGAVTKLSWTLNSVLLIPFCTAWKTINPNKQNNKETNNSKNQRKGGFGALGR